MESEENVSTGLELQSPSATDSKDGTAKRKKQVNFALENNQEFPYIPGTAEDAEEEDDYSTSIQYSEDGAAEAMDNDEEREGDPWYMYPLADDVEKIEEYRPGGYHPVRLGDRVGGQYKIIHKLGHGGFGTVWLAREITKERYVAVKIVMAKHSKKTRKHDLKILKHLGEHVGRPGGNFVDIPIEDFWITGPNGEHLCIVSDVAGPSIAQLTRKGIKFEAEDARRMALQVTQSLGFLHSSRVGVAYGDLTTSNVLLELQGLESLSEEKIYELLGQPVGERVRPFDGKTLGPSAPDFVYQQADLTKLTQFYSGNIIIIDFGAAFFLDKVPDNLGTPAQFCAPELLIQSLCGKPSDVWALACTIFEMRSGHVLFEELMGGDEDVLMGIRGALGPFPLSLTEKAEFELLKDAVASGAELEELVFDIKDISEDEAYALFDLLGGALRYAIEERFTVEEILRHPYFSYHFRASGEGTVSLSVSSITE